MEREKLVALVTGAQNGSSEAMNELFAAFYNDVYYFALKTVKDSDIACDITQETFLEIIRTVGELKEPAAFVTWMKQITYHQCTRYFRKKKDVQADEDEDGHSIFDTLADEREGSIPAEVYEKAEFRQTILDMINELTEEQRAAVLLYYFDELPVGQIAKIQGVSEGTVKSRLNYARKSVKKSVEDYEKKNNIKLHSFAFLPLFMLFFAKAHMPADRAEETRKAVAKAAKALEAGYAAGSASASASASASGAAAAGFGAKLAALPLAVKLVAAVTALALLAGLAAGVAAGLRNAAPAPETDGREETLLQEQPAEEASAPEEPERPLHYDDTADGLCDDCGEPMCLLEIADHRDEDGTCRCDLCDTELHTRAYGNCETCEVCGSTLGLEDPDGDGLCNACGEGFCGKNHPHADTDEDDRCDHCEEFMCGLVWGLEHNFDYSDGIYDSKCDNCGGGIGGFGWGDDEANMVHTDADGDGFCECCAKRACERYSDPAFGGVDADGDGKCDCCGLFLCDGHGMFHYHCDFDGDEKCDSCGHFICAHGFLPHTDENGDSICDNCFYRVN